MNIEFVVDSQLWFHFKKFTHSSNGIFNDRITTEWIRWLYIKCLWTEKNIQPLWFQYPIRNWIKYVEDWMSQIFSVKSHYYGFLRWALHFFRKTYWKYSPKLKNQNNCESIVGSYLCRRIEDQRVLDSSSHSSFNIQQRERIIKG